MLSHLFLTIASALLLLPPPPITLPTDDEIDVQAIAEIVIESDPEDLLDALDSPFPDEALPEEFLNPPRGDEALIEESGLSAPFTANDYPGGIGDVSFAFDTNPDLVDGILTGGMVSYVVTDHDITRTEIRAIHAGMEQEFDEDAVGELPEGFDSYEALVELVQFGGVESAAVTVVMEGSSASLTMTFFFVPVAHTLVITTVVIAGFSQAPQGEIDELVNVLAGAVIHYLGDLAESVER